MNFAPYIVIRLKFSLSIQLFYDATYLITSRIYTLIFQIIVPSLGSTTSCKIFHTYPRNDDTKNLLITLDSMSRPGTFDRLGGQRPFSRSQAYMTLQTIKTISITRVSPSSLLSLNVASPSGLL